MRPRKPISYCVDDGIGLGKLKRRLESSNLADLVAFDFELCLLESFEEKSAQQTKQQVFSKLGTSTKARPITSCKTAVRGTSMIAS